MKTFKRKLRLRDVDTVAPVAPVDDSSNVPVIDPANDYGDQGYDSSIYDSNIIGFTVSIANVNESHHCNAQANAAILVAGEEINAEIENEVHEEYNKKAHHKQKRHCRD